MGDSRERRTPSPTRSHQSLTRSLSCPSIYEETDVAQAIRPRGKVRKRAASLTNINPPTRPFNDSVIRFAKAIQSVNVYERIDYDTSDEENDSDLEGYESDYEGPEEEFQWEEDIAKPPTYGAVEGEKLVKRRKTAVGAELELRGTDSNRKTVFTIFKAFIASGILFLPNGVMKAGWMLALIMLIFTAVLTTWCMLLLLWAKDKLVADGKRVLSFGDVGEYACGPWGRRSVDIAIFGAQLGFCCAYFGFVAENLHSVVFSYFDCLSINKNLIMICMIPLLTPMVWVRKLKHYAITNIIADILIVAPLVYIMSYEVNIMKGRGLGPNVEAFRWSTCLPFFGTTVYSMEGISMIIPIEQSMKKKEDLPKVLCGCMIFITALMGVFGVISYFAFGDETASIITLNLGDPTQDSVVVDIIKLAYCVAIIFTFPLMMFPVVKIVERNIFKKDRHSGKKWSKNFTRLLLVMFCCGIAILGAEQIDNFVSIIGSVTCVPLAFIFPAIFHLRICCQADNSPAYFNHSFSKLRTYSWSNIAITIFGFVSMIMATGLAVYAWMTAPEKEPEICHHHHNTTMLF